jgi:hypothetical protein
MRLHRFAAPLAVLGVGMAAACTTGPSISVAPSTGLVDGQAVTVTGRGYAPNSSLGMVQCVAGADSIDDCDGRTATSFSADATGGYRRPLTVHRTIQHNVGQTTDCSRPGACIVASVYIHGFQGLATHPIQFHP